jgi:hypothetical protein
MTQPSIADDILQQVQEIAAYIGKSVRQTQWLLESNQLPAFKIGRTWHMRKSTYLDFIKAREAEASSRFLGAVKQAKQPAH